MSSTLLFSYSFQQPQLSFVFFLSCLACYMNLSMIPLTSSWHHVILTDLPCLVIPLLKPIQRFLTAYISNFLAQYSSSSQSDFGSLITSNPLSCTQCSSQTHLIIVLKLNLCIFCLQSCIHFIVLSSMPCLFLLPSKYQIGKA